MKKKIQALACAAMLAVGGFNVWTAMDNGEVIALHDDDVERLAEGEDILEWIRTCWGISPVFERGTNWKAEDIHGNMQYYTEYTCVGSVVSQNVCVKGQSCFRIISSAYGVPSGYSNCPFSDSGVLLP